jgi:hypothetical protein
MVSSAFPDFGLDRFGQFQELDLACDGRRGAVAFQLQIAQAEPEGVAHRLHVACDLDRVEPLPLRVSDVGEVRGFCRLDVLLDQARHGLPAELLDCLEPAAAIDDGKPPLAGLINQQGFLQSVAFDAALKFLDLPEVLPRVILNLKLP